MIPGDYAGVLVTDRFSSYEAAELRQVQQHKCLAHLLRNIREALESKSGRARTFGLQLEDLLRQALQLWRRQRAGPPADYAAQVEELEELLTCLLRPRRLRDPDNQRRFGSSHIRPALLRDGHDDCCARAAPRFRVDLETAAEKLEPLGHGG